MDDKERKDYAEQKEQQLRAEEARIVATEARARENQANEQLKELTGIKKLQTSVRDGIQRLKAEGATDWDTSRSEIESAWSAFVSKLDEVRSKLHQIDRVREDKLNAQLDQLDAEIVETDARIAQETIAMDAETAENLRQVHEQQNKAREKREQISAAREEARDEMRSAFKEAIDKLQQTWQRARKRVETARREGGQPHA